MRRAIVQCRIQVLNSGAIASLGRDIILKRVRAVKAIFFGLTPGFVNRVSGPTKRTLEP